MAWLMTSSNFWKFNYYYSNKLYGGFRVQWFSYTLLKACQLMNVCLWVLKGKMPYCCWHSIRVIVLSCYLCHFLRVFCHFLKKNLEIDCDQYYFWTLSFLICLLKIPVRQFSGKTFAIMYENVLYYLKIIKSFSRD